MSEFYSLVSEGTLLLIGKNIMQPNKQKHRETKHITTINSNTISNKTKMSQSKVKSSKIHLQLGKILLKSLVQKGSEDFS